MKPKKSLGQNFLINPRVAERIAKEANISSTDIVLEIGPGKGYLTKYLLPKAKKVIAVEKDERLADELAEKYKKEVAKKKLIIIKKDILDFATQDAISNFCSGPRPRGPDRSQKLKLHLGYKIVANIPYNITGAILKKFLSGKNKPESMTLMVQQEVAERMMARDGKESLLSISVKAYGTPKILFNVSRGNFFPAPNVDSAVIGIKDIHDNLDEDLFWEVLHAGFAHKRKKLFSNLKTLVQDVSLRHSHSVLEGQVLSGRSEDSFEKHLARVLGNKRAEELSVDDWVNLLKIIHINKK